jgi:excisionase family DNA binding protein
MSTNSQEVEWIKIHEVMKILSVSRDAVRALIRDGRLTVRMIPSAWVRIPRAEVEAMAARCTVPATTTEPPAPRKRKTAAERSRAGKAVTE